MQILHGENTVRSRQRLSEIVTQAKSAALQVAFFAGKDLDKAKLEDICGSQNLFGQERLIIIEELFALPKSKKKDELIQMVANQPPELGVVLWEKKQLTTTMLKPFANARVEHFPVSSKLFSWLDSLHGAPSLSQQAQTLTLLHDALETDGDFLCFSLLTRQVRLLLLANQGSFAGVAPFLIKKLSSQAKTFTLPQLLSLHARLFQIDLEQKTSSSRKSLTQELELFSAMR